jgi:hypothetical protein
MPIKTSIVGLSPNEFQCEIDEKHATVFEDQTFEHLRRTIARTNSLVRCYQIQHTKDSGRNIVIKTCVDLHILGQAIAIPPGNNSLVIYIEVKATASDRLDGDFLVDYAQDVERKCDIYLLATDATITPYWQYLAHRNWDSVGRTFLLSDRWLRRRRSAARA